MEVHYEVIGEASSRKGESCTYSSKGGLSNHLVQPIISPIATLFRDRAFKQAGNKNEAIQLGPNPICSVSI